MFFHFSNWFLKVRLSEEMSEISFQVNEKTKLESLACLTQTVKLLNDFGYFKAIFIGLTQPQSAAQVSVSRPRHLWPFASEQK
jgi:hypothetical protein